MAHAVQTGGNAVTVNVIELAKKIKKLDKGSYNYEHSRADSNSNSFYGNNYRFNVCNCFQ